MTFEDSYFKKKLFDGDKLLVYGFERRSDDYHFTTVLPETCFEVKLVVRPPHHISGQVFDVDLGEEYTTFRAEAAVGNFVGLVREEYGTLLAEVAEACCQPLPFASAQANRLHQELTRLYGDQPDHPFDRYPDFTSYRVQGKWYALLMQIERKKLDLSGEDWEQEELAQLITIVNVKVRPDQMPQLLAKPGIYPSYHMSKKSWVSLVLDEDLSDQEVLDLLARSRRLATPKGLSTQEGPTYWIIPANPIYFDVDAAFAASPRLTWHQKGVIQAGDVVGIYITAPAKELRYLCQVKSSGSSQMELDLLEHFPAQLFSKERLAALGVKSVRGPRRMTMNLIQAIKENKK